MIKRKVNRQESAWKDIHREKWERNNDKEREKEKQIASKHKRREEERNREN